MGRVVKRWLRKTAAHLHVGYAGTFTNNLSGDNFTMEIEGNNITIGVDLSRNIRTRNKSTNTYLDAADLAERHAEFELIQIHDSEVCARLGATLVNAALHGQRPSLSLSLSFGALGTFLYPVQISQLPGGGLELTASA